VPLNMGFEVLNGSRYLTFIIQI